VAEIVEYIDSIAKMHEKELHTQISSFLPQSSQVIYFPHNKGPAAEANSEQHQLRVSRGDRGPSTDLAHRATHRQGEKYCLPLMYLIYLFLIFILCFFFGSSVAEMVGVIENSAFLASSLRAKG
jgi:hypothetical protein